MAVPGPWSTFALEAMRQRDLITLPAHPAMFFLSTTLWQCHVNKVAKNGGIGKPGEGGGDAGSIFGAASHVLPI
jgi:hypothetical protein